MHNWKSLIASVLLRRQRWLWCFLGVVLLPACSTQRTDQNPVIDTVVINSAVLSSQESAQALQTIPALQNTSAVSGTHQLDVGIVLFESQEVVDAQGLQQQGVFPLVRKAESRYLPYLLRQTLVASQQWGVVRVMPAAQASTELIVRGELQISNGEQLQLFIQAEDSSGRQWLVKVYRQHVDAQAYDNPTTDPFQPLFDRIAWDLAAVRSQLSTAELNELRQLALLRYGQQLAPAAFADYLLEDDKGLSERRYQLQRLPAHDDPMLTRIRTLREYEYYFIDTVDQQYENLFTQMQQTYQHWRQYSRELMEYMRDYQERQAGQSSGFRRGSLASMDEVYGDYTWYRTQQKNLSELAAGFNNEVLPTVLHLDDNVIQLDGNLQQQYQTWQNILQQIFNLEQGAVGLERDFL